MRKCTASFVYPSEMGCYPFFPNNPYSTLKRAFGILPAIVLILLVLTVQGCGRVPDAPYPESLLRAKVLFTCFGSRPKYLDPVSSYSNDETPWTYSIYEPPLQYDYLKRPFTLEGRTVRELPTVRYLDAAGRDLPADAPVDRIATSVYTLRLIPGIRYQPHPAFARDAQGRYLYQDLRPAQIAWRHSIADFPLDEAHGVATATRELTAEDYVYEIKRLASPYVHTPSPIYGIMAPLIVGMKTFGDRLRAERTAAFAGTRPRDRDLPWRDLRTVPLPGARALDRYTLEIRIHGVYPQFRYWLAMTFFSPIPWEADRFYAQRGMADNGLTLNFWPVGTGPFMLVSQSANRYVMRRNPNFHGQRYPSAGMPGDAAKGLLIDAGKPLPFVDEVISSVEKEQEPALDKFLQGYYDVPYVERLSTGFVLEKELLDNTGRAALLRARGVQIIGHVGPSISYIGFNWLDPVVGGGDTPAQRERNRKLRQAISIAHDWEEYRTVFFDTIGASKTAMGPIPPGVFGYRGGAAGIDPVTHVWADGHAQRRSIAEARRLLAEAGYPDGRDAKTGKPLVLTYDTTGTTPAAQAGLDWEIKQFAKLGIQLEIRAEDYNRFQERVLKGEAQIFSWGWYADYPDPENFLFLLYGPQGKAKFQGENAANYENPEYDRLYQEMRVLPDGAARQAVIDRMVQIVQRDNPWMWGYFPAISAAYQPWVRNANPSIMVRDQIKYLDVDPAMRWERIRAWNRPHWWPLAAILAALSLAMIPLWRVWRAREQRDARTAIIWEVPRAGGSIPPATPQEESDGDAGERPS